MLGTRGRAAVAVAVALTALVVSLTAGIASAVASQQVGPSIRNGPYLGQTPPGSEPELFGPGLVSLPGAGEYGITFSPDGREVYFTRTTTRTEIMVSRWESDGWTAPAPVAFSAEYSAQEPHVTFDNRRIYWGWRGKSTPAGNSYGIYVSERTPRGWSAAEYAGQGMYVTSSRSGRMYVTAPTPRWGRGPLAEVTLEGNRFAALTLLPDLVGAHPGVAPDESYILFDHGNGMMRVSFLQASGAWGEPVGLTKYGIFPEAWGPSISPDGRYLFFSYARDIYWVSTTLIEDARSAR